ncbi:MAG: hypothetical protein KGI84_04260, partial [Elusimicrobia bacterium]|nr:hypothetical protein [Elusimicrobiota bacterium]
MLALIVGGFLEGFVALALVPFQIYLNPSYPQSIYSLLVLLVAIFLAYRSLNMSVLRTFLFALVLGVTLLFRSSLFLFPVVLAAYEWVVHRHKNTDFWKHAVILCSVPYFFLLPWVRMNWVVHHQFIPFEYGQADSN